MKIIPASYKILDDLDGPEILRTIERAGRVCYKSEDKITDGSAERFVRSIIERGHESVMEHVSLSVRFIVDRGVSHELVRHRLASYCVTGDTVLRGMGQKSWTVEQLYQWQNDSQRKSRLELMNIRSVDEESRIVVSNKIDRIYDMGERAVYELRTESGRHIRCTEDHKLLTPSGYKELQDFKVGDEILCNGLELLNNEDWLRWFYLEENHTRKEVSEAVGCCESYVYKALKKFDIVKPLSDRPNRKPGHGNKGMFSDEALRKIRESKKGRKNVSYVEDRNLLTLHGGYMESQRKAKKVACENCGATESLEIHHINKNPRDNRRGNLKVLCTKCHNLWHKPGTIGLFSDRVVSVSYVGVERVYDVSMKGPYHNFVANGIVAHNCQESTRYCNYSKDRIGGEITVIAPCFANEDRDGYGHWVCACEDAEYRYFVLLNSGWTPQEARSVLPNSLKTEVVMTANLREWRHILRLRTDKAAHPSMREVMVPLLAELKERVPVIFDDIGGENGE